MKLVTFFLCLCFILPGSAAVIYRATDIRLGSAIGGPYGAATREIDVDGDAVIDWAIDFRFIGLNRFIFITDEGNNRYLFRPRNITGGTEPAPLDQNFLIDGHPEGTDLQLLLLSEATNPIFVRTSINDGGVFDPGSFHEITAFLGFEFEKLGDTHYGYAEVTGINGDGLIISGLAWESEPGVGIRAGAIPEPSAVLLLGFSMLNVFLRRGRRRVGL